MLKLREQTTASPKPRRVAVYVDELKKPKARRKELAHILLYTAKAKPPMDAITIFGTPATDADHRINRIIARLE